jgi:hypothetical protein
MNNLIKYNEWKVTNTEKYISQINKFYQDEDFLEDILIGEEHACRMLGKSLKDIVTYISDNENLIIRYVENEDTLCLLGLTTENGKILKNDLVDIYLFCDILIEKIENGKQMITFPNDVSEMLIDKMIKIAEKRNIFLYKKSSNHMYKNINKDIDPKFAHYKMIVVKKV